MMMMIRRKFCFVSTTHDLVLSSCVNPSSFLPVLWRAFSKLLLEELNRPSSSFSTSFINRSLTTRSRIHPAEASECYTPDMVNTNSPARARHHVSSGVELALVAHDVPASRHQREHVYRQRIAVLHGGRVRTPRCLQNRCFATFDPYLAC